MKSSKTVLTTILTSVLAIAVSAQRGGRGGAPGQQGTPTPPGPPRVEELKKEVAADIETMKVFTQQMVDQVFSFGELGFQEFETSKYLTGILEKNGFTIERGVAGIPTAWMATWGSGKPVIALGSDIDDIPQASQKPGVAYHEPIIEGAPGHGEGHNSGMPLQHHRGARGEEDHGARAPAGHAHALAGRRRGAARHQGVLRPRRRVQGRRRLRSSRTSAPTSASAGATAAATAWSRSSTPSRARARTPPARRGAARSALDAVELMDIGWNFRREHLRLQQRSHYVITNGGDQPNVVPPNASRLVLLPRDRLRAHQGAVGHRRQDGQGAPR